MFAALIGLLGCATGKEKPDEPIVKKLDIEGTKHVSAGELKDKILTEETSWWPFAEKHYFDPNAWQADLRRIIRTYQSEGYYNARIVNNQIIPKPPDSVALKVQVDEGPPTHVRKIVVEGLDALPPEHRDHALSDLPFKEGAVFKEAPWETVKGDVQSKLRELGYAEAVARTAALVDTKADQAELRIDAEAGQRYRFGDVFISTNAHPRVRTSWIRDQAKGAIKEGSWFSETAIAEAQARVFRMGVFGAVKVNAGAPDRRAGTLPVVVDVREAPFHTIRTGVGAGFDQTRNEARITAEYVNRDFFGGLRKLTLYTRAGWAFLPNIVAVIGQSQAVALKSEPFYLARAELEQPRAFFRDVRLQTSLESQRGAEQAYSFIGGHGRVGFVWQPHPAFSIVPSYNLEVDYLLSGQTTLGGRAPDLFGSCTGQGVNCLEVLSYLEQAVIWDRRDNREDPRKGYYFALAFQEGGGPLGGSFDYLRIVPEARYYRSFPRRTEEFTVAVKLKLGTLQPLGGGRSPIVARFFSGGDAMRGFNYRRLSPLLVVPQNPSQTLQDGVAAPIGLQGVTVPIGGDGLFESSLELRYNISGNFVLAGFLDAGFVTSDNVAKRIREDGLSYFGRNLQYAVGAGLRYRTPVGPVRLDLARRLNFGPPMTIIQPNPPLNPPAGENGFFGLDWGFLGGKNRPTDAGYPEGFWAFHLSIGEAF